MAKVPEEIINHIYSFLKFCDRCNISFMDSIERCPCGCRKYYCWDCRETCDICHEILCIYSFFTCEKCDKLACNICKQSDACYSCICEQLKGQF